MSNELSKQNIAAIMEKVVIGGDLSKLDPVQRMQYYNQFCESLGLNPLTRPFEYIQFQGKLTLYARKDCTEQLRFNHHASLSITAREVIGDVYVVTAKAVLPNGRTDESTGCVPIAGLKNDALGNAYMKAETKAKRRVTLSICGLGCLDESEADSIPGARVINNYDEPKSSAAPMRSNKNNPLNYGGVVSNGKGGMDYIAPYEDDSDIPDDDEITTPPIELPKEEVKAPEPREYEIVVSKDMIKNVLDKIILAKSEADLNHVADVIKNWPEDVKKTIRPDWVKKQKVIKEHSDFL